jgi:signal transduction histidine kinase/ActR/RegA family two-component response regulator
MTMRPSVLMQDRVVKAHHAAMDTRKCSLANLFLRRRVHPVRIGRQARGAAVPARPAAAREAWVLLGGAIVILLLTSTAVLMLWRGRQESLHTWQRYLDNFSITTAEHASQTLRSVDFVLGRVVDRLQAAGLDDGQALARSLSTPATHSFLRERVAEVPVIDGIALYGMDGSILSSSWTFPPPRLSVADREYFQAHVSDPALELHVSPPAINRITGRWTFSLSRKLRSPSGRTLGVAVASIELSYFEGLYRSINFSESDSVILLLRRDGTLLMRYPLRTEMLGRSFRDAPAMRALAEALAQGRPGANVRTSAPRIANPADAQPRMETAYAVAGFPLAVGVTATESFVLRGWRAMALFVGAGVLVTDALIAALTLWIHRLLRRRRAALLQLEEARKAAEEASLVKSQFLANMSHEIRTPLNAIIGLTELLRRDQPTPTQVQRLDRIDMAGRHLLSTIDDILDISKIEAGRLQLEQTDFHLSGVLDQVQSIIAEQARGKGLAVTVDGDAVPLWLRGDPTRLRQALLNYASNALKFTQQGFVAIRSRLLGEEDGRLLVRFEVQDSGIGIPADKLPGLLEQFKQADASTTREYGGTGLGLSITQHLARMMGGEAGATSTPGSGSTFWFTARLDRGHGPMPDLSSPVQPNDAASVLRTEHCGKRVLLAEDNFVNREVAVALLNAVGLVVETAANGQEAIEKARAKGPDLILMDMQMPVMDGLHATRVIRTLPGWESKPIVALTANAFSEDQAACIEAGMSDFLAKPVEAGMLYRVILKWMQKQ